MGEYLKFQSDGWRGVHCRSFQLPEDGLAAWLDDATAVVRQRAGSTVLGPTQERPWFVKLLTAVSSNDSWLNRLKWRFRPSRALHVWRISQAMRQAGIGCPEIMLAARRRSWRPWGWPADLLVMAPAAGVPLARRLKGASPDDAAEALEAVAMGLAQLHEAGFAHGDCIPWNLYLEPGGQLNFIDNDRTCRIGAWGAAPCRRNLVQLGYHLLRDGRATPEQLDICLRKYCQCRGWDDIRARREMAKVNQDIRRRQKNEP